MILTYFHIENICKRYKFNRLNFLFGMPKRVLTENLFLFSHKKYILVFLSLSISIFISSLIYQIDVFAIPSEISNVSNDFNFVAAGDFSCNKNAKQTVNGMIEQSPEIILALGDLSYKDSGSCWIKLFPKKYHEQVKVAIGYHDVKSPTAGAKPAKQYVKHFDADDKQYYSFDYKNVHFIAMSTETEAGKGSKQYKFVKNDLEKASENENIDWIVVFGYRPLYSSESEHQGNEDLRTVYHPLFDKYGVDLVLNAHNHNYQRTYPIEYNDGKSFKPKIINTDKKIYDKSEDENPVFITVGTGGESLYPFQDKSKFIAKQAKEFGFLEIKVKDDPTYGTMLEGNFHKNKGNDIIDSFTIHKQKSNSIT